MITLGILKLETRKIILILVSVTSLMQYEHGRLSAQTDSSSEGFFPSSIGNIWNYRIGGDTSRTLQTRITKDSINAGTRFLFYDHSQTPLYKIDTALNVTDFSNGWIQYKLTAREGDVWTAYELPDGRIAARIDGFYWDVVLDKFTQVMRVGYYRQGSDTTFYYGWLYENYLAAGFGYCLQIGDASQTPNVQLLGCKIDGITYGSVVGVNIASDGIALEGKKVLSAFPNPFNSATTLWYSIPRRSAVRISVFSLLGIKIMDLVDGFVEPGEQSIRFEPLNLPSGLYFVRIATKEIAQTIKIIYSK